MIVDFQKVHGIVELLVSLPFDDSPDVVVHGQSRLEDMLGRVIWRWKFSVFDYASHRNRILLNHVRHPLGHLLDCTSLSCTTMTLIDFLELWLMSFWICWSKSVVLTLFCVFFLDPNDISTSEANNSFLIRWTWLLLPSRLEP